MKMECWGKMRNVWVKVGKRLGLRKTGLVKLRNDVKTCEYEDVQILWEMLKKNDKQLTGSDKGPFWDNFVNWAKCAPFLCHAGSCTRAM